MAVELRSHLISSDILKIMEIFFILALAFIS